MPLPRRSLGGLLAAAALPLPRATPSLHPVDLRCESLIDPLGVDASPPRLSWRSVALDPAARGLRQAAWQIRVASSAARLEAGTADLWDSGCVASRRSLFVP